MTESALERKICDYVKRLGGRAFKFVSPGCPGVPDRICLFPGALIVFVEVKRPERKDGLSSQQRKLIGLLRRWGFHAWVVNDFETFRRQLDELRAF